MKTFNNISNSNSAINAEVNVNENAWNENAWNEEIMYRSSIM